MIEQYFVEPFDWTSLIQLNNWAFSEGSQVLHFSSVDKPYGDCPEACGFVETYLSEAQAFSVDASLLRYACDQSSLKKGLTLEMGVCSGRTINFIAALNPEHKVYGFDSFEGLPQAWEGRKDYTIPAGEFGLRKGSPIPAVLPNVCLIKGLFSETLPVFSREILKDSPIRFLHIDCDLYQSTVDVFQHLGHGLMPGSVILFDELYNYPGWHLHEWKALQEFLQSSGKKIAFIAFNENREQVLVRFI